MDTCAICDEPLARSQRAICGCEHVFHDACLDEWAAACVGRKVALSCPLCRRPCAAHVIDLTDVLDNDEVFENVCVDVGGNASRHAARSVKSRAARSPESRASRSAESRAARSAAERAGTSALERAAQLVQSRAAKRAASRADRSGAVNAAGSSARDAAGGAASNANGASVEEIVHRRPAGKAEEAVGDVAAQSASPAALRPRRKRKPTGFYTISAV